MLKLRYYWKLHHATKENIAHCIYKHKRNKFLQSNVGFVHEVFNLCCKFGRMDLWHGICPKKTNPYTMIKKMVEGYYYTRDIETAKNSQCAYTAFTTFVPLGSLLRGVALKKTYHFDTRLKEIGMFYSIEHRRLFLYSFLETGAYNKVCRHCGGTMKDMVKHSLDRCTAVSQQRRVFRMTMTLYNAPTTADLRNKATVFSLALTHKIFLKTFCEFLAILNK